MFCACFPGMLLSLTTTLTTVILISSGGRIINTAKRVDAHPIPRWAFAEPSPLATSPADIFMSLSAMGSEFSSRRATEFPSVFDSSFSGVASVGSSSKALSSDTTAPFPYGLELGEPSLPGATSRELFLTAALLFAFTSRTEGVPSSVIVPTNPRLPVSTEVVCLCINSGAERPSPACSNLATISFMATPLDTFPEGSPVPFAPSITYALPPVRYVTPT